MPSDNELHKAANKGDLEAVKMWIESPPEGEDAIDINSPGAADRRPIHRAAGAGHTAICQYLIDKGADVNIADKSGRTALHWAAIGGFPETVIFLLQHGADLYAKTTNDMNAVHAACEAGKVEVVRAMYEFCDADGKAKLSAETCSGKTAWDIASGAKQQALCTALKEAGDTNAASAACIIS